MKLDAAEIALKEALKKVAGRPCAGLIQRRLSHINSVKTQAYLELPPMHAELLKLAGGIVQVRLQPLTHIDQGDLPDCMPSCMAMLTYQPSLEAMKEVVRTYLEEGHENLDWLDILDTYSIELVQTPMQEPQPEVRTRHLIWSYIDDEGTPLHAAVLDEDGRTVYDPALGPAGIPLDDYPLPIVAFYKVRYKG